MKNGETFIGKTILLVNTGSIKKRFILRCLKKMGLVVICLNKEKNWANNYVDHWILADTTSHTEAIQAIREFVTEHPEVKIDGALTFWEDDVLLTAKITDRFNFIGVPFSIAKRTRNKFAFREFCVENNIPSPNHTLLKSAEDIKKIAVTAKYPMVIKPAFGASSAYVVKVNNQEELLDTYKYIKNNISTSTESSLHEGLDIFVEDYIEGDEVDIDIILQNGKIKFYSISDNAQTKEPFFIETGRSTPSSLSPRVKSELIDASEEVLEKLGVSNALVHFEAKATQQGPVPIEVNLRMGGDEIYSSVKGVWGVDLIEAAVKIALGIRISKIKNPEAPAKYITSCDFLSDYSGVLLKLNINKELYKKEYFEEMHIFKKIGEPILVPPEGYEYLGWITVSGHSMPQAQENLKEALRNINYEVARFAPESSIGKTSRKNSFSHAELNTNLLIRSAKIEKIRQTGPEEQKTLHIGIACNIYDDREEDSVENELMSVGKNIYKTLKDRGYKVTFFDFNNIDKVFNKLKNSDVDLVFNVCERINDSSLLEPHGASLLDILQIPYTGSNPSTLALCIDKIRVKKLLSYHNIPTPNWDYVYTMDEEIADSLRYPQIVKPASTDNSIGITNDSVVRNEEERKKQLEKIIVGLKCPALIEEYIEGDEYDVSIMGSEDDDLKVLPLSRSIFREMPQDKWHIYTHEMKFGQKKISDYGVVVQRPAKNISKKLESLLTELGLDTYNILDCHDYGRVEIRVDENDNPYVLELNPNPSINIGDCVSEMAKLTSMDYGDFLEEIIRMAIKRYQNHPPYYHLLTNTI